LPPHTPARSPSVGAAGGGVPDWCIKPPLDSPIELESAALAPSCLGRAERSGTRAAVRAKTGIPHNPPPAGVGGGGAGGMGGGSAIPAPRPPGKKCGALAANVIMECRCSLTEFCAALTSNGEQTNRVADARASMGQEDRSLSRASYRAVAATCGASDARRGGGEGVQGAWDGGVQFPPPGPPGRETGHRSRVH